MRGTVIKLGLMVLQCHVEEAIANEDWSGALKLCTDFTPEMNAYLDVMEGREDKVLKFWLELCDFAAGCKLNKVA